MYHGTRNLMTCQDPWCALNGANHSRCYASNSLLKLGIQIFSVFSTYRRITKGTRTASILVLLSIKQILNVEVQG